MWIFPTFWSECLAILQELAGALCVTFVKAELLPACVRTWVYRLQMYSSAASSYLPQRWEWNQSSHLTFGGNKKRRNQSSFLSSLRYLCSRSAASNVRVCCCDHVACMELFFFAHDAQKDLPDFTRIVGYLLRFSLRIGFSLWHFPEGEKNKHILVIYLGSFSSPPSPSAYARAGQSAQFLSTIYFEVLA